MNKTIQTGLLLAAAGGCFYASVALRDGGDLKHVGWVLVGILAWKMVD